MISVSLLALMHVQAAGGSWDQLHSVYGTQQAERHGFAIDWLGDLDLDGSDEFIASSTGPLGPSGYGGSLSIYSGTTGARLFLVEPDDLQIPGDLGYRIARLGDVTSDGLPEFLAYIGSTAFAPARVAVLSTSPLTDLYQLASPSQSGSFGFYGIVGGTDLNADGVPDIAITDYDFNQPLLHAGAVHAYDGRNGAILWTFTGDTNNPHVGTSVAMPGDLDGDGHADVIATGTKSGNTMYVLSGRDGSLMYELYGGGPNYDLGEPQACGDLDSDGRADFLAVAHDTLATAHAGVVTIRRGYDGAVIHRWDVPPRANEMWGYGFGPGDVDGDCIPDVAIGAQEHYASNGARGGIYVYSGRTYEPMALIESPAPASETYLFGLSRAPSMGDVGNDARSDLLVSDYAWNSGSLAAVGAAYVFGFDAFLTADEIDLSAAAGGVIHFHLDFPISEGGRGYRLLASDDLPGSIIVRGVGIPLVMSALLTKMINAPPPLFDLPVGSLDPDGDAWITATIPANALAGYVGRTVKFAAVSLVSPSQPSLSSAAIWLDILP